MSTGIDTNQPRTRCLWAEDEGGVYTTACDHAFEFIDAGPRENGFGFCPYCGLKLEEVKYPLESGVG